MKILCNLNLFALEQTIYLIDDQGEVNPIAATEIEQLPEVIAAICNEYDAHDVTLIGNNIYALNLADGIREYGLKHYSNNKIEVRII